MTCGFQIFRTEWQTVTYKYTYNNNNYYLKGFFTNKKNDTEPVVVYPLISTETETEKITEICTHKYLQQIGSHMQ